MRPVALSPYLRKHRLGFTLIELMVTVSVVAILGALAVPSLRGFFVRNAFSSIGNEFQGSLLRARNEAVSKNICATMCMSNTVDAAVPFCKQSGQDWQVGWIVFMNPSCDVDYGKNASTKAVAAADMILVRRAGNPDYALMAQSSTRKMMFNARGNVGLSTADRFDLTYTDTQLELKYGFNICLDTMGRSRSIPVTSTCTY
ncbi:hypothetical protein RD110_18955 [Rhodoferax koreense]|uniref:Type II secretion system protein H n=1 Tax=Rhodoferax koreensis TaxID=1842727 RepID=A0A1P8JZA4_9BURK|nr:GspH/FimT family pseudopilin [Rhodoferax koreense]APW39031.1 hypothetical protein RD110_18955 [Rhodoferax koreense]